MKARRSSASCAARSPSPGCRSHSRRTVRWRCSTLASMRRTRSPSAAAARARLKATFAEPLSGSTETTPIERGSVRPEAAPISSRSCRNALASGVAGSKLASGESAEGRGTRPSTGIPIARSRSSRERTLRSKARPANTAAPPANRPAASASGSTSAAGGFEARSGGVATVMWRTFVVSTRVCSFSSRVRTSALWYTARLASTSRSSSRSFTKAWLVETALRLRLSRLACRALSLALARSKSARAARAIRATSDEIAACASRSSRSIAAMSGWRSPSFVARSACRRLISANCARSVMTVCDCTAGERTGVAAVQALDLLDLGARLGGARPGHAELVVQFRQLLLADEPPAGADDVVLSPELLDPVLGLADAGAQLLETGGERVAGAAGGFRLRRRAFLHVGVHERVGQASRFLRVPGHDRDVDHEAALGAANGDALVELVQHGDAQVRRAPLPAEEVGDERLQGGDRRPAPLGEFGIALEAFAVVQKVEHLRRLEHPHLALDERHVGVGVLGARVDVLVEHLQPPRVDDDLRRRDETRRRHRQEGDRGGDEERADQEDQPGAPPKGGEEPAQVDRHRLAAGVQRTSAGRGIEGIGVGACHRLIRSRDRGETVRTGSRVQVQGQGFCPITKRP